MEENQRERLNLARDILLGIAGVGGILLVAAIAPGAIGLLAPLLKKKYKKSTLKPNHLQKKFNELKKQGLIMIGEQNGQVKISLTKEGKKKVLAYQVDTMELKHPAKWDGKWRIVIFDIPEGLKNNRNTFREKLIDLGFEHIQDSVWISKYPCREEIDFLAHLFEIWPHVDLIEGQIIKL
ncbi:MAG: hypothetical protein V1807_01780 [Patescibacteria group bacterium]